MLWVSEIQMQLKLQLFGERLSVFLCNEENGWKKTSSLDIL